MAYIKKPTRLYESNGLVLLGCFCPERVVRCEIYLFSFSRFLQLQIDFFEDWHYVVEIHQLVGELPHAVADFCFLREQEQWVKISHVVTLATQPRMQLVEDVKVVVNRGPYILHGVRFEVCLLVCYSLGEVNAVGKVFVLVGVSDSAAIPAALVHELLDKRKHVLWLDLHHRNLSTRFDSVDPVGCALLLKIKEG